MSNKRDKTPTQDRFKPSGKLAQQQNNKDKEFQEIVKGFEQLGEAVEESIVNRSKILEADTQSKQSRAKSGEKKKFKVNPNLKKSIDPELIKQQLKEEKEQLEKQQAEEEDENELVTQKGVSFFGLEKQQTVVTKRKGFHGMKVSKDEFKDILSKEDGISIVKNTDNSQIVKIRISQNIKEGTFEEEELQDQHKPENMFEPTKLPFVLSENAQKNTEVEEKKPSHQILNSSKFNLIQFPAQFVYKLPQNSKTKIKLKKLDVEKLHDQKEILSFNAQKPYDSAGNSIKYNYSTIDYFAQRDPKKEQGYNMGKLRFYSDGSVQLICGQNIFDVTEGVQNQCKQQFIAIDQNMHLSEQPTMFKIDDVDKKFVIQPNIDELYKK